MTRRSEDQGIGYQEIGGSGGGNNPRQCRGLTGDEATLCVADFGIGLGLGFTRSFFGIYGENYGLGTELNT
ncbi:MAG: hypothetical protein ACYTEX_18900 [Planctomycetota bacterium]|jgi:hypothetical protein